MIDLGRANRDRSNAQANAVYSDTRAGQFVEQWANLTSWSSSSTVQVSGGRMYSNGSGAASGVNHALGLAAGATCRIVTTVKCQGAGSGGTIVGISSDTAGGAFTSGGSTTRGLYWDPSGNISKFDNGTSSASSNATPFSAVTYTVTMIIDANYYSIVAVSADGTQEYRAQWTRASMTPNNLTFFNSDSAQLSGKSVGPVGICYGVSTITPRAGIEGLNRTVYWSSVPGVSGAMMRIALPANYDPRIPTPFVLMWHGHSSNETHWADNGNGKVVANALLAAGFITIGFAASSTTTWGAQAEQDAAQGAYKFARDNFNLGQGLFYCNSMGSINGLYALSRRYIPGINAYIGTSPTFDLSNNYNNSGQPFKAAIDTAYSLTTGTLSSSTTVGATSLPTTASYPTIGTQLMVGIGTANVEIVTTTGASTGTSVAVTALAQTHASADLISDYPTKTAGHDPALLAANLFRGMPALIIAASDDTTVDPTKNAAKIQTAVTPYAPEVLANLTNTGGHSFDFTPFTTGSSTYDIVKFAQKHVAL
ncbi:hypothetical protein AB6813_01515 [bacterium RCC_150]